MVATGRNDAIDMLEQLGADLVVDYQEKDADAVIKAEGPYVNSKSYSKFWFQVKRLIFLSVFYLMSYFMEKMIFFQV